ncbi:hypothetical protein GA0070616_2030 [Micromonospora nigra]|uniref:Uncharacterized protein n=1 Tax=Micromonospora nigra TaxID=145857 RepID=A0A1C6RTQ7_9ACTN|nr:SCP2 sterol-binding domain-containing protein [Micromonospora nigra]SCL20610.1 hypothetical protein GA0070616_2030 [Micromonospora nigra]
MSEAIEQFFAELPARAPAVLRGTVCGTLQLNISDGERTDHWLVLLRPGHAEVTHGRGPADAIWYGSRSLFERLITGQAQGISAMLRSESNLIGEVLLYLAFRRFWPAPPGTRDPRDVAREQAGRPR